MVDAAGVAELKQFLTKRRDVIGETMRFERRINPPYQPTVLRRQASWTVIGMTALSLDTADGKHGFTADVDHVASHCHCHQGDFGKTELPRADEGDALIQFSLQEQLIDAAKSQLEWHRDVIRKDQRRGASAAFSAVDRDEIDRSLGTYSPID